MSGVRMLRAGDAPPEDWKGEPGTKLWRLIGAKLSTTMGAGILELERTAIPSTIDYDEICVVLDGQFRSRSGDQVFDMGPGDVLWVPANSTFTLETDSRATIFFARVPLDPSVPGLD